MLSGALKATAKIKVILQQLQIINRRVCQTKSTYLICQKHKKCNSISCHKISLENGYISMLFCHFYKHGQLWWLPAGWWSLFKNGSTFIRKKMLFGQQSLSFKSWIPLRRESKMKMPELLPLGAYMYSSFKRRVGPNLEGLCNPQRSCSPLQKNGRKT